MGRHFYWITLIMLHNDGLVKMEAIVDASNETI